MPAITTTPSSQLSMSRIRQFLASAGGPAPGSNLDLSLSGLEVNYMGNNVSGTGAIVTTAKLCMWRQQETFNRGPDPGSGHADYPTSYTPGSTNKPWDYYGGTGVPWRPSRISEFQQAYYNPPSGFGYGVATGARNSTGIIRFDFAGGSQSSNVTGPSGTPRTYYLYVITGSFGISPIGGWVSTASSRYDFACGVSASVQAYVVDDLFCGGQMTGSEIRTTGSASYP